MMLLMFLFCFEFFFFFNVYEGGNKKMGFTVLRHCVSTSVSVEEPSVYAAVCACSNYMDL